MNRRSNASCLTEQEIEEFLFNRLSGVTREVIEEHLLVCQKCLDRVEAEEDYVNQMKLAAREVERETLERAYSGAAPSQGWAGRLAAWFGMKRPRTWMLAVASLLVAGAVSLFQFRGYSNGVEEVSLELYRSGALITEAKAKRPLRLTIPVEDLAPGEYRMELVNATGKVEASGSVRASEGKIRWDLKKKLDAGNYWVRVQEVRAGGEGELVREFGLRLK